mgnify:CR=1 FL=1
MTEDELDRIKKSFVRSSDECPMEVACLLTVMKYYGGQQDARTLAEWCKVDGKYTLMGMKQAAIRAGMEAEICLQNMEQLSTRKFPAILFAINDFEVPGYVVCYGIHEGRFIIWEPGFGPMQYWENIMDKRNNSYSVSHPRIYAENGFSTKMVGVVSVEQEMEKKTEPLV